MDNTFYKVDLHVHTPASKCYTGDKSDDGYWAILENAVKNNVRVIAITDHNTFAGYEYLMKLKEETFNEYSIIQKYNIAEEEMKDIKYKKDLFDNVCVILGVEITLNPGVHIIVLCDANEKNELGELLDELGYTLEKRGIDDEITSNMDVKKFLESPKLEGKIVIAPHVDSDKGIWSDLKGGYRENVFKSSRINAITCNSASQLSHIQNLVCSQPGYIRKKTFAYINASDAHEQSKVGSKFSFFKLKKFTFHEIKKAIELPEECISDTENPKFGEFVEKCEKSNPTIYLNQMEDLLKALCAILNNGYGCIFLGITKKHQLLGISIDIEKMRDAIKKDIHKIDEINKKNSNVSCKFKVEQLGNGKSAGVILVKNNESSLWIYDENKSYIIDSQNGFKVATIKEIETLVRGHILSDFQDFNARNNNIVSDAINKMNQLLNPISKYTLYNKLESMSIHISYYFNVELVKPAKNNSSEFNFIDKINGQSEGNVYYAKPDCPRLKYAYLRYSCPVYLNQNMQYTSKLRILESPTIVITKLGGCHLINPEKPCYFESQDIVMLLTPNETFYKDNLSIYHVIGWLKSNFCIWACLQKVGDSNIFFPPVFNKLFLPYGSDAEYYKDERIKEKVKNILELEYKFLCESQDINEIEDGKPNNAFYQLGYNHNNTVCNIAGEIDAIIKDCMGITNEENDLIHDDLHAEHIYPYNYDE